MAQTVTKSSKTPTLARWWRTTISWRPQPYQVILLVILAFAAYMRFHLLAQLPPGLHPDEAADGIDTIKIIVHHDFQAFYPDNGGREGLLFIVQAFFVWVFGYTTVALRMAPALFSLLAVWATYLWANSWFGRRVGLLAAALMAVTPWAVIIGRDSFRAGMVALMIPLTLWLYTRAVQTGKRWWYIGAGVSLGAGFYTYIAYRAFPAVLLAALAYLVLWRRQQLRAWKSGLLISLLAMLVTVLPMGVYAVQHPADVLARPGGVSFTNPGLNHGHPLQTLADSVGKTLLMFNFAGDQNYRQNLGGTPELNTFVGIAFLLGIFLCLVRLKRLRYFILLAVWGVMLLPEMLSAEGIPHALRAIGALPPTIVLAAVGISYLLDVWYGVFPRNQAARACGTVAVGVLLALTVYQGYVEYFVAWANSPNTYAAYSEDTTALATYYDTTGFHGVRYVVTGDYSIMPVDYLTYQRASYTRIDPPQIATYPLSGKGAKEFTVLEGDKENVLKVLKTRFPKGHISPHYSGFSGNELFVVYTVPAS